MFNVNFLINTSPKNKINKSLTQSTTFSCALKDDTSILNPVLMIRTDANLWEYNYINIPTFGRYYFITDIVSLGNNLYEVRAHIDVLQTYAAKILQNTAVVKRQQGIYNLYLDDPDFHVYNYERIQTLKFPDNDFNKELQYVLVVNGQQALTGSKGGEDNANSDRMD